MAGQNKGKVVTLVILALIIVIAIIVAISKSSRNPQEAVPTLPELSQVSPAEQMLTELEAQRDKLIQENPEAVEELAKLEEKILEVKDEIAKSLSIEVKESEAVTEEQ